MAGQSSTEKDTSIATSTKAVNTTTAAKGGRRHGGTAATGSASDPPHVCGICNKCFDRSKWFPLVSPNRFLFNTGAIGSAGSSERQQEACR